MKQAPDLCESARTIHSIHGLAKLQTTASLSLALELQGGDCVPEVVGRCVEADRELRPCE